MTPQRAIVVLQGLLAELEGERDIIRLTAWRFRVDSVFRRALGEDHHLLDHLRKIGRRPTNADARPGDHEVLLELDLEFARSILWVAVSELEDALEYLQSIDSDSVDPDLWAHVEGFVLAGNWQAVASQTAIFVEDRLRRWCGRPTGSNGQSLVGKALYGRVFADDGDFRLGKEPGEWEGWRAFSTGFAQALGNVDRHNIQDRDDARRYAYGVLGAGSLILTQLRHQHGEHLNPLR